MKTPIETKLTLEAVAEHFEQWRRCKKKGERIPEHLWGEAIELLGRYGISQITRTLRLSGADLNKRRGGRGAARRGALPLGASPLRGDLGAARLSRGTRSSVHRGHAPLVAARQLPEAPLPSRPARSGCGGVRVALERRAGGAGRMRLAGHCPTPRRAAGRCRRGRPSRASPVGRDGAG